MREWSHVQDIFSRNDAKKVKLEGRQNNMWNEKGSEMTFLFISGFYLGEVEQ